MTNSNVLESFKSKINYRNKTIYGIIMIILGLILWWRINNYIGTLSFLILILPSVLLVIPNEKVKNSKVLGIILAIILIIMFILCIGNIFGADRIVSGIMIHSSDYVNSYINIPSDWNSLTGEIIYVNILQIIYIILNLISCCMLTIPTNKNE